MTKALIKTNRNFGHLSAKTQVSTEPVEQENNKVALLFNAGQDKNQSNYSQNSDVAMECDKQLLKPPH